jgi:hypothetical protein
LQNLWKCRYHVYWNLSYPLSILKVIYTRPLKKLKKIKMARSTGVHNPPKLLLTKQTFDVFNILISVKWNFSSHILYFIYMQKLAIQFVEMHCTRTHISFFLYIDQHPGNKCVLFSIYRTIYKQTCVWQLKKITTVFLFQLLQFDYEVWEIIIYFTTCFSFWSLFYTDFLQRI